MGRIMEYPYRFHVLKPLISLKGCCEINFKETKREIQLFGSEDRWYSLWHCKSCGQYAVYLQNRMYLIDTIRRYAIRNRISD